MGSTQSLDYTSIKIPLLSSLVTILWGARPLRTVPRGGGTNYIRWLVVEHTVTDNVTALGGNMEVIE